MILQGNILRTVKRIDVDGVKRIHRRVVNRDFLLAQEFHVTVGISIVASGLSRLILADTPSVAMEPGQGGIHPGIGPIANIRHVNNIPRRGTVAIHGACAPVFAEDPDPSGYLGESLLLYETGVGREAAAVIVRIV